ncbi:MAG: heterodisulfide reductase-related iron-sulfur binding cluster [Dokdonella sp.]
MAVPLPGLPLVDTPLLALTDQCVMCGLCLPHCPTYRLENTEAESPRGRIALARALATGALDPSSSALAHLDHCLGCLSCQKVCPSQVNYDEILVRTRSALIERQPSRLPRWLRDPRRLTVFARLGAALRTGRWLPPLARLLRQGSLWRRIFETQPDLPLAIRLPPAKPPTSIRGRVVLFRGCVARAYDADTHVAARCLLEALGYEVVDTPSVQCCGALSRHVGESAQAAIEANSTREALLATGADIVLVSASGCFGDLHDQVGSGTALRVADIHAFLAADPGMPALRFKPLALRAALHLPCTQVNVVGEIATICALLARIPQLSLLLLPEQPRCCGAAGSYFLEQPGFADRLRNEKLDQAQAVTPDVLLTTNIGCRIHLGNGLRERATSMRVLHPLALLAQQLENPAS